MTFVRNCWYVASWARDLQDQPIGRTVLGEDVAMWRRSDGTPAAVENLCPHRFLPLSMGQVVDGNLRCGYHGLTFDSAGDCLGTPVQDAVPECQVRHYPVAERMGMIWIWMGDPALADADDIYDLPEYHLPGWGVAHGDALDVEANYLLLCDNLCDPTHVTYVHPTTLGSPDVADVPVTHTASDDVVTTSRWTPDSTPVGFFQVFGDFDGKTVDRWQHYHMHVPSIAIIDFGSAVAGTGAESGGGEGRIQVYSCHFMTPITETRTIDYWLHVRNFAPGDASVGEGISDQFRIAFAEDKEILQAVQAEENRHERRAKLGLDLDASSGLFRRLVNQRIRAENQAQAAE